jgi:hypothetical protein
VVAVAGLGTVMLVVQVEVVAVDVLLRMVPDPTVIQAQITVVIKIWADAAYLGKDFQAVQELETIVKTKTAIMRVVEAVLADRVIAVKMINNKDCCETVALE